MTFHMGKTKTHPPFFSTAQACPFGPKAYSSSTTVPGPAEIRSTPEHHVPGMTSPLVAAEVSPLSPGITSLPAMLPPSPEEGPNKVPALDPEIRSSVPRDPVPRVPSAVRPRPPERIMEPHVVTIVKTETGDLS